MKITHIITRMILGGAQENTLFTCEGLHQRGHHVTLITGPSYGPEGKLLERAHAGGYQIIEVPTLRRAINPFHDLPCYFELKRILADLQSDIVHTHSAKAGILGRLAAAAVRKNQGDACCAPLRALRTANAAQCRRPVIIHTVHGLSFHPFLPAWKNKLYIAAERRAAPVTDHFITVAQAMTDQSLAAGIGQPGQYSRIFSGIETADFLTDPAPDQIAQTRRELNIPPDAIIIVAVARLAEFKGHDAVIQTAAPLAVKHPNLYWLFVGDGYLRSQLEAQIARANLSSRFRLTGLVPPDQVPRFLHACDILVHCSLREGLARVLPQALLCAKPVVSYDIDGAREVVTPDTGFLVPPQNTALLTAALETLIAEPALRHRLGAAGRAFCREQFPHTLMVDRIEEVYRRFIPQG